MGQRVVGGCVRAIELAHPWSQGPVSFFLTQSPPREKTLLHAPLKPFLIMALGAVHSGKVPFMSLTVGGGSEQAACDPVLGLRCPTSW